MHADLVIRDARVLAAAELLSPADLAIADGLVVAIGPRLEVSAKTTVRANGQIVSPGLIDLHLHGAAGAMCEDADPEGLLRISATLAGFGVTGFLATLAAMPPEALRAAVANVAAVAGRESGARILGLHLEGPYLNPAQAGAQPRAAMRTPSVEELDELQSLSGNRIRLLTLAPELDGALPVIRAARERGIVVGLGHSAATAAQVEAAIAAGAGHVTHLFNAMPSLHHRTPGLVGVALTDDRVSVEVIADGHHLDPRAVDIAFRCKPEGQVLLISDAVAALGMPDGAWEMLGARCLIQGGAVRLESSGHLAGSCLRLDQAVRNVHRWLPRLGFDRVLRAASTAPAAAIGLRTTGEISVGRPADLVLLDGDLRVMQTWIGGVPFPAASDSGYDPAHRPVETGTL